MQALLKRQERWKHYNQQRLELVLEISLNHIQKLIRGDLQLISFLLYLAFKGGAWVMEVSRVLWIQPKDLEKRLQDAEQQRLKLNSYPNHWLK